MQMPLFSQAAQPTLMRVVATDLMAGYVSGHVTTLGPCAPPQFGHCQSAFNGGTPNVPAALNAHGHCVSPGCGPIQKHPLI